MKKDISMLGKGKSDPYAVITVGAQEFKTKTINNTVDPKWDFWCEVTAVCFVVRHVFVFFEKITNNLMHALARINLNTKKCLFC